MKIGQSAADERLRMSRRSLRRREKAAMNRRSPEGAMGGIASRFGGLHGGAKRLQ